jgi:hypothetical protein
MVIPNSTRAWLYLVPLVPSIVVTIFNLYYFLGVRALRTAVNNHVIILILSFGLISELTGCIWNISFLRTGIAMSSTNAFCLAWAYLGSVLPAVISILMAWASIERHIIIFYPNLVATKIKRYVFHYIPLAISILWPVAFYCIMLLILPCSVKIFYIVNQCNLYSCILKQHTVSLLDTFANYIIPAFVTAIFSVALLIRVLYVRYRIRGRIDWRNYRKMAAQLLPISALYILLQLPPMILYAGYEGGLPSTVASSYYNDALFFNYWVVLLTPFVSVVSVPDLKTKCRNLLFWRRRNAIQPAMIEMARRNAGQTVAVVPVVQ